MLCYTAICFTGNCTLLRIISFFLKVDITSVIMQITLVNLVFMFDFVERNTAIYALFSGRNSVLYASFSGEYGVCYVLKLANTLVNLVFLFHFLERNTVIYSCLVVGTLCYTPALVVSTEYTMF